MVKHIGNVISNNKTTLYDTLHIPNFKFNLLWINKLSKTSRIKFVFYPTYYILQDLQSEEILSVGKILGSLYNFNPSCLSFSAVHTEKISHFPSHYVSNNTDPHTLWHKRLRHAPYTV